MQYRILFDWSQTLSSEVNARYTPDRSISKGSIVRVTSIETYQPTRKGSDPCTIVWMKTEQKHTDLHECLWIPLEVFKFIAKPISDIYETVRREMLGNIDAKRN